MGQNYQARILGVPVIDATKEILAVHQNHSRPSRIHKNVELSIQLNREISKKYPFSYNFNLKDATHSLTSLGLKRISKPKNLYRRLIRKVAFAMMKYFHSTPVILLSKILLFIKLRISKKERASGYA